jgi:chemotaxis protein methyltransferase CheR
MAVVDVPKITDQDFKRLSEFIYNNYGIKMPYEKKVMLEGRLRTRLRVNNINSYKEYCDYVFSAEGEKNELVHMIDTVSTNKTDFFREPIHFNYMTSDILPDFTRNGKASDLKIWCSATSTGEEPYTIAITLEEYKQKDRNLNYSIYCTDISTRVLEKAILGIYTNDRIVGIPQQIKTKYFLKSKNTLNKTSRIIPEIRKNLTFNRLNLMDDAYQAPHLFDIIFCRNVLIYFDRKTQEEVVNKLCSKLNKNGYLILGHSESITGFAVPLQCVKTTIYQKI